MNTQKKNSIIKKYQGRLLGQRGWDSPVQNKFYVEDFIKYPTLFSFIGEIESREADLTNEGVDFLKEYYGVEELARILHEAAPLFPRDSIPGNKEFLTNYFEGILNFYKKNPSGASGPQCKSKNE